MQHQTPGYLGGVVNLRRRAQEVAVHQDPEGGQREDTQHQSQEIQEMKIRLADLTNLKPFNLKLKTKLLVDASKLFSLGFVLLQLPEGFNNF